jgi:hypothetical protein
VSEESQVIYAAGAVLWRQVGKKKLELAIIHRPRYDLSLVQKLVMSRMKLMELKRLLSIGLLKLWVRQLELLICKKWINFSGYHQLMLKRK